MIALGEQDDVRASSMESCIVRVYRRDAKNPTGISGLVEIVESGATRAFRGSEDLWAILAATGHTGLPDRSDRRAGKSTAESPNGSNDDD